MDIKEALREFGIRVGYEIGAWVDANAPQPDVPAIVDALLAASDRPSKGDRNAN